MGRIFLKKIPKIFQCRGCYFFIKNPMFCEKLENCIKEKTIYKQVFFERVEGRCGQCYFSLRKPPWCRFPMNKHKSYCNEKIYKKIKVSSNMT